MEPTDTSRDVVIVGGGLAGSTAAILLARQGLKVAVVDPNPEYPRLFRAEKIEPDQIALLKSFGLLDAVLPRTRLIREIVRAQGGRVRYRRPIEQFGISYQDIVNQIRAQIPPEVEFKLGRVETIASDAQRPHVVLASGEVFEGRLVVLSNGMGGDFQAAIGLKKRMVHDELSMAFGFDLAPAGGGSFPFDAVTYRPSSTAERVGYLTLFRIGESLRANFFTYWTGRDPKTKEMVRTPKATLSKVLPGLDAVIGDYEVTGRVEPFRIDLFRFEDCARPGVVMLGDACQSVCPTTGMGMSKVLTDVDILCNVCAPGWFASPGMGAEKIKDFYAHPRKLEVDDRALRMAVRGRQLGLAETLSTRVKRGIRDWRWATGV